jgi:hypothetical protein
MTSVIAWISYSDTGESPELPRAMYMASDSRITWGTQVRRWDAGRKIFSPYKEPHLFGYCGDVVFPSLVLGQLVSAIDHGILFPPEASAVEKNSAVFESIKASHKRRHNVQEQDFTILHVHRCYDWPSTTFAAWVISYAAAHGLWNCQEIPLPLDTAIAVALGSGADSAKSHVGRWADSDVGGTSRAIFSAFCDAITSGEDRLSGGVPQMSGLYTEGPPQPLGYIENGLSFLHGLQLEPGGALSNIEWRDRLFQRVDPRTRLPIPDARRFARPRLE